MLIVPVTTLLTAVFALMLTALSLNVSLRRRETKVAYGDGDDPVLKRRMRAHGNLMENAPINILAVLCLEIATLGTAYTLLWILAAAFIISRTLHAWGTLNPAIARKVIPVAVVLQHITLVVTALRLLAFVIF